MPPKVIFNKEKIIKAAFEIFKNEGIDSITARSLAAKMGCSTAPIYTCFQNIDEIKQHALDKAFATLQRYTEKKYTGNAFLNIGVGVLCFARDYKRIYKTLFLESSRYISLVRELEAKSLSQINRDRSLADLNEKDLNQISTKMTIFTYGLSAFLCADMLEDTSNEFFIKTLDEAGSDIMTAAVVKKRMTPCQCDAGCKPNKKP
jgi:AcrR family transcriptional regulator